MLVVNLLLIKDKMIYLSFIGGVMSCCCNLPHSFGSQTKCQRGLMARARRPTRPILLPGVALILTLIPSEAFSQDTPDYYRQNCMNCHTIGGGRLTGPDLKDVTKRKDAEWLIAFMQNPRAVIDSGDAYAAKMVEESRGVIMPNVPGMTRYRAEQILKLIEAESQLEKSQFQGIRISDKPFTESDRIAGREIFLGKTPLANGGTACIACHSMYDLPALGGGRLGPDLTRVYERLKGRQSLSAWLMAPATETMQPIFKNQPLEAEEIHALTAYFDAAAQHAEADASVNRVAFLLWGLALAAATIFGFDAIWKKRFHGVRQPLVEANRRANRQGFPLSPDNPAVAAHPNSSTSQHGT